MRNKTEVPVEKPGIKTITIRNLTNFLLVASIVFLILVGFGFRVISYKIIESKALAISEVIIAGLTSHMKAEVMEKRDYFLEEIKSLYGVESVSLLITPELSSLFKLRSQFEKHPDPKAMHVFESGKAYFKIDQFSFKPNIRAIIPYPATKKGKLNCLTCHDVKEGTVLGAVEVILDLSSYRNIAVAVMSAIFILSAIFIILLCRNVFKTVQYHIKEPLENLIDQAKNAYFKQEPIKHDEFDTAEFEALARKFNMFNAEVLSNQEMVRKKNLEFNAEVLSNQEMVRKKNQELKSLNDEISDTLRETVFTMGVVEEQRSLETADHTKRVTEYCNILATKLGLSKHDIEMITSAAPLHDIGKLGIPDSILFKPGKLTDEEFSVIQNHPGIGYAMLVHSQRDILKAAAIITYQHHEKWDGSGYPQGLSGEDIHIYGRILALADVFDALTSDRVYRKAMPDEEVLDLIRREKDKHFDPMIVDIFFQELDKIMAIKKNYHNGNTPICQLSDRL
ncbi:MAG: HD domain-containing protein [Steroidobacteraceae bacterium]|nr:HD domain-containing protein [Deltaproteobacteria bacterium]